MSASHPESAGSWRWPRTRRSACARRRSGPSTSCSALLREGRGLATRALRELGVEPADLAQRLRLRLTPSADRRGRSDRPRAGARAALQMARAEAARLHHDYLGTEHLLLGLLRDGEGPAFVVLNGAGVTLGAGAAAGLEDPERVCLRGCRADAQAGCRCCPAASARPTGSPILTRTTRATTWSGVGAAGGSGARTGGSAPTAASTGRPVTAARRRSRSLRVYDSVPGAASCSSQTTAPRRTTS